jgi:hypothetical protein
VLPPIDASAPALPDEPPLPEPDDPPVAPPPVPVERPPVPVAPPPVARPPVPVEEAPVPVELPPVSEPESLPPVPPVLPNVVSLSPQATANESASSEPVTIRLSKSIGETSLGAGARIGRNSAIKSIRVVVASLPGKTSPRGQKTQKSFRSSAFLFNFLIGTRFGSEL